jgi:hypothetical protein
VKLPTACTSAAGELTYSFTLASTSDVRVAASTTKGSATPVFGLRDPGCTQASDELDCRQGGPAPILEQSLPAGTYVITMGATAPLDATLDVQVSPPTAASADETCASPPAIAPNAAVPFDLSDSEDAIKDGCMTGVPHAAFDLSLASASDVLLIERLGSTDTGGVSLDSADCDASAVVGCATGTTPIRVGKRDVAAGDYRAVVADRLALQGSLDVLVRPTVAPTIIPDGGATTCNGALDISAGGFFTGSTVGSKTMVQSPCDSPGAPGGGEAVQVLSLNLPRAQRVVLDMEGSQYTTLLDVRQGPGCPGTPYESACYVGFGAQKSFLDLELKAGQYFVIISGYSGGSGSWDLDVRILPPQ